MGNRDLEYIFLEFISFCLTCTGLEISDKNSLFWVLVNLLASLAQLTSRHLKLDVERPL